MANKNSHDSFVEHIQPWIIPIIMLFVFWPLGLLLIVNRLRASASGNSAKQKSSSDAKANSKTQQKPNSASQKAKTEERAFDYSVAAKLLERDNKKARKTTKHLLFGIALAFAGGFGVLSSLLDSYNMGLPIMGNLFFYLTMMGGGLALLYRRYQLRNFAQTRAKYLVIIGKKRVLDIGLLASRIGCPFPKTRKDIQLMINEGYFGNSAYIDAALDALVIDSSVLDFEKELKAEPIKKEDTAVSEYDRILQELCSLNERIEDPVISSKIEHIEETCSKIFKAVQENPDKLPKIRRFMNYYLPTTLKLLRTYAKLEDQGIRGETIDSTKKSIENVLAKLASGFDSQLDQLFRSDAIDISADINVLENMMIRDGLDGGSMTFRL